MLQRNVQCYSALGMFSLCPNFDSDWLECHPGCCEGHLELRISLCVMMRSATTEILLLLFAAFPLLEANDPEDKNSPFYYDYASLRLGGLIFAGVLCFLGIIILISGKCKCKPKRRSSVQIAVAPKCSLPGDASEC
nr:FXYD domain-containing ion transport regulator 3-like isoform X1 [Pogona vitticeps]